jgi:hypothetical protein
MSVQHSSMTPTEVRLQLFPGYHPLPVNGKYPSLANQAYAFGRGGGA